MWNVLSHCPRCVETEREPPFVPFVGRGAIKFESCVWLMICWKHLETLTSFLSNHQHRFITEDRHSTSVEKEDWYSLKTSTVPKSRLDLWGEFYILVYSNSLDDHFLINSYTLSNPENDRDVTERVQGIYCHIVLSHFVLLPFRPLLIGQTLTLTPNLNPEWQEDEMGKDEMEMYRSRIHATRRILYASITVFLFERVRKHTSCARDDKRLPPEYTLTSRSFSSWDKV